MISNQHVRRLALALLLSAGACGDDGDDDDDTPRPDAASAEAGAGGDAGDASTNAPDAGEMDAGGGGNPDAGDAGAQMDARVDASPGDASTALMAALERTGIRVDAERAELVIQAFCQTGVRCNFNDAGVSENTCLTASRAAWADNLTVGYSPTCLDTQLDLLSCTAVTACDRQSECDAYRELQDQQCDTEDAGS